MAALGLDDGFVRRVVSAATILALLAVYTLATLRVPWAVVQHASTRIVAKLRLAPGPFRFAGIPPGPSSGGPDLECTAMGPWKVRGPQCSYGRRIRILEKLVVRTSPGTPFLPMVVASRLPLLVRTPLRPHGLMMHLDEALVMAEGATRAVTQAGEQVYTPRGLTGVDAAIFILGMIPFVWASIEFWRRIAVGEPFGTTSDSVVIRDTSGPSTLPERRRVLGKGAIITARLLFAAVAVALVLVAVALYQVLVPV